jgi:hypothetical protein
MGEYVTFKGQRVKVGTCENYSDMRFSDLNRVTGIDASDTVGLRFRLPWPDEDGTNPGEYGEFRGLRLYKPTLTGYVVDYNPEWLDEADAGHIQFRHENSGLQLSVPCHHGNRLPDLGDKARAGWNGKGHSMELIAVKVMEAGEIAPIVWCRHCEKMWRVDWDKVLPFVADPIMKMRLSAYNAQPVQL